MLVTLPGKTWIQLRMTLFGVELLYKPYGFPLYGAIWRTTFKLVWRGNVVWDSCGHLNYWCNCK